MDYRSQSQNARLLGRGDAAVVRGEQAGQGGNQVAQEQPLGNFVRGSQQDQDSVSPIGKRVVVMLAADSGYAQGFLDEPVKLIT